MNVCVKTGKLIRAYIETSNQSGKASDGMAEKNRHMSRLQHELVVLGVYGESIEDIRANLHTLRKAKALPTLKQSKTVAAVDSPPASDRFLLG